MSQPRDRLDVASMAIAAAGLALALRSRFRLEYVPLVTLALPTLRWTLSSDFRERNRAWWLDQWAKVQGFAANGGTIPWLAAFALVVAPFFLFDLTNGKTLGAVDTRPVIPTAACLVTTGHWDLSAMGRARDVLHAGDGNKLLDCYQNAPGGQVYSAFPPGMVPFAVPIAAGARIFGADLENRKVHIRLEKLAAAGVASVALGLFFLVACRVGSARGSAVVTALLATGSAMFTTVGLGLWQHGGVTVWLLLALLVEFRASGKPQAWGVVVQGCSMAMLLTCRPTAALIVVAFGTWVLLRSPTRAIAMAGVAVVAYLPWVMLYLTLYGNPIGSGTQSGNMSGVYWHFGRVSTMLGVLICPSRGLFIYQPWAILAMFGAWGSRSRPGLRGWPGFCATTAMAHAFVISAWHDWSGGWCWGSRLLTDIIPLVGLLAVGPVDWLLKSTWGRAILVILGILGFLVHLPAAYLDADLWNKATNHASDLWSWSNAPFFYRPKP